MNRKQYIQSLGATCNNWQNSWSFIHREKKFVIFGDWQNRHTGLIFSEDWKSKKTGRRTPGYKQSKEHIRLVWEEGYDLYQSLQSGDSIGFSTFDERGRNDTSYGF